jgi:xanthine dehydrogenase YagS FAD-binding subunit
MMHPFKYEKAKDVATAIKSSSLSEHASFLAGGTNLIDLMKEDVEQPGKLIDINTIKLNEIRKITNGVHNGGISLGSLATNTATANHPLVRQNYPLLTQAILAGASAQIRNMATNGGNLNQRTRCPYFYEVSMPCNKRAPGTGCSALKGINKQHAIFGWSDNCVAVHPSDMCVALAALDAVVKVQGTSGERSILFTDYHRLPGNTPGKDNNLNRGELVTGIEIPPNNFADKSYYLKVRDRSSYAFALISVAAAIETAGNEIKAVRIALGSVAHKPWRAAEAENALVGKAATEDNFKAAATIALKDAKPLEHNLYKVELTRKAIARALLQAMKGGTHV